MAEIPRSPLFRVYLLGPFTLHWRTVSPSGEAVVYQEVAAEHWGKRRQAMRLLMVLLARPGRRASKDFLLELFWPETEPEPAGVYLIQNVAKLRKVLRLVEGGESLLIDERTGYRLASQEQLWVDADAAEALMQQASVLGTQGVPLAQEAITLLQRGTLLEEEEGTWVLGRRGRLEDLRKRSQIRLAQMLAQQDRLDEAESTLYTLLEEDPIDEDVLCHLMELLHQQGLTQQALRVYERSCEVAAREELELTEATKKLAARLEEERHSPLLEEEGNGQQRNPRTQDTRESLQTKQMHREQKTSHSAEVVKAERTPSTFSISQQQDETSSPSRFWNVPYQRNPLFTGREDVLMRLHDMLTRKQTVVAVTQHALCGLGGIGKTQTVLEYIYRYGSEYQAVFWIKADTRENLFADFLSLAQLLALPERDAQDQTVATAAIQRWLQEHVGWLLVFDNADDLEMVREVLPTGCQGHVLLTTRAQAMGRVAHRLEVEEMSLETGALFLLRRASLIEPDAPLEKASEKDRVLAEGLVQELGGLPLALDQAGAYIEETASSLQEYLDLYHTHRLALLQRRGGLTTDHPESVATTWALAFTHIENSDPVAASLLRLCAFLDPDAIPEEILFAGLQQLAGSMSEIHQLRFNEAIGSLLRFSLVRRNADTHTITVHRLIQSVVRDNLLPEQQSEWIQRVVHLLSEAFPPAVEVTIWPTCEKFLPHALLCAHWIERAHITSMKAASLLNTIGYYLNMRARYEIAMPLFQRALRIREQVLGEQHPDTAQTLSNLAYLYHHQDQFEEAMHFLQRSLFIRQQVLGVEHPDTATSLNALALLYRDQGRYEEAEPFFQRALAIRKQIFGIEHPQTAHSLSNLAWLYRNLGKYHEAEPLYEQSLTIRKRILGVDHPDTATSLNGLALLYAAHKNYAKAEPLFQQAVTIRKQVLGTKHLHTTQSMNALALLYRDQGEYEKAERLFLEVLAIREQILGSNHPRTATSLYNLALLYYNQSKFEQAEPLFQRALTSREHLFGREHPRTLVILNNLTLCQNTMKK